jgi:LAO/AO transport system kinase
MRRRDPVELVDAATAGDRAAVARLISLIERGGNNAREVGRLTFPRAGQAYSVGLTGAPGAGKSTITDRLIGVARSTDSEVGVLAVDPTSPFSGGAFLGDRVRMQDHALDSGVFIRSMATRGHLGGLSLATPEAVRVLDACGFPLILIETVGVGQVEIEIAGSADTTVVVLNPGAGDAVQASKAGLLEVADLFVINKADRPGVDELERDIDNMLDLNMHMGAWRPPIVRCVGTSGEGIDVLWDAIGRHWDHLSKSGELDERRRRRLATELRDIVVGLLEDRATKLFGGSDYGDVLHRVVDRSIDPYTAADQIVKGLGWDEAATS